MFSKCWKLFASLFKIGLFTFGGGFAMLALLESEFVERRKWIDHEEFMDIAAISESTPGPIAINAATYIGYKVGGIAGSIAATIGVCIPSFVVIYIISLFFDRFMELSIVAAAFKGIQVCVCFLIFSAGVKMLTKMKKKAMSIALIVITMVVMILLSLLSVNFSTIFYILVGGLVGLCCYLCSARKEAGK